MAVRAVTKTQLENGTNLYTWTGLTKTTDDSGDPIKVAGATAIAVQVTGTLGSSGTVQIQGSMAGTTYGAVSDLSGNALTLTALGFKNVGDRPVYIRPAITNGENAVTDLTVTMHVR